jgi:hypothetical protein
MFENRRIQRTIHGEQAIILLDSGQETCGHDSRQRLTFELLIDLVKQRHSIVANALIAVTVRAQHLTQTLSLLQLLLALLVLETKQ